MAEIKIIPDTRMEDLVINALEWALEAGEQTTKDLIHGMRITPAELEELGYDKEDFPEMHESFRINRHKNKFVDTSRRMSEDWNRTVGDALSQYQNEIYKTSSKSELKNLLTRIFDSTKLTPAERRYADKILIDLDNKRSFERAIMFVYDIILAGNNLRSPDSTRGKFNRR